MDKVIKHLNSILKFESKYYNRKFTISKDVCEDENLFESLVKDVMVCTKCNLHTTVKNKVFGMGPRNPKLMIIGEAPGADEDKEGLPFVGRAGEKLTKMLEYININREEVFITNLLKCRPPQNADPLPEQISSCLPFLQKQVELLKPKIILTLGRYAASIVTGNGSLRMLDYIEKDSISIFGIPVISTYHPAVLLHSKGEKLENIRIQIANDLKRLKSRMERI